MRISTQTLILIASVSLFSTAPYAASYECPATVSLTDSSKSAKLINVPSGWDVTSNTAKLSLSSVSLLDSSGKELAAKTNVDSPADIKKKPDRSRTVNRSWILASGEQYSIACSYYGLSQRLTKKITTATSCEQATTVKPGLGMTFSALSCK